MLVIPFGQAWAHCFTQLDYVIYLILATAISAKGLHLLATKYDEKVGRIPQAILTACLIGLFMTALLKRPSVMSNLTSPEEAAQGIFINKVK